MADSDSNGATIPLNQGVLGPQTSLSGIACGAVSHYCGDFCQIFTSQI